MVNNNLGFVAFVNRSSRITIFFVKPFLQFFRQFNSKKFFTSNHLLVNLLSHDVGPIYHASTEVVINGTRAPGLIDDGDHAIVVVQVNLADVSLVRKQ